jgi:hypothetical protein
VYAVPQNLSLFFSDIVPETSLLNAPKAAPDKVSRCVLKSCAIPAVARTGQDCLNLKSAIKKLVLKNAGIKISPIREPSDVGVSFAGYALRGGLALETRG